MDMFVHLLVLHFRLVGSTLCYHHPQRAWRGWEAGGAGAWGQMLKDTEATEIRGYCGRSIQALSVEER